VTKIGFEPQPISATPYCNVDRVGVGLEYSPALRPDKGAPVVPKGIWSNPRLRTGGSTFRRDPGVQVFTCRLQRWHLRRWLARGPEAPNSKAHSNTRHRRSDRMPNRRPLERCRSSFPEAHQIAGQRVKSAARHITISDPPGDFGTWSTAGDWKRRLTFEVWAQCAGVMAAPGDERLRGAATAALCRTLGLSLRTSLSSV
jgi:hypothetical protein